MYVHSNILILNLGANNKIGAISKSVNELYHTTLSQFSPVPRVRNALEKMLCVLSRNRWPFEWLLLAIEDDDRRLADMQPQLIRSIRMKKMKKIVH
jgi:hypothetical protein